MKALVISSFPLLDRLPYKIDVLRGLADRDMEVLVIYGGTRIRDYVAEIRRRGADGAVAAWRRIARKNIPQAPTQPRRGGRHAGRTLLDAAHSLGYDVRLFDRLADEKCLRIVRDFSPEIAFNLSSLYIPRTFLDAADRRVVGAHYADLPRIRGGDTIRWSILLDHPLVVSHLFLAPALDMGHIIARTPVAVAPGDTIEDLRRKCTRASAAGHLRVADLADQGLLHPRPQTTPEGSTFYRMGRYLREKTDEALARGTYSHFTRGNAQ